MKGNNELHLNGATMIEAVQEYLDKRMGEHSPFVTNITFRNDMFIVSTEEHK